jgi:hypothetical protein
MLSDHFLSAEQLADVSERIKNGEPVAFDEASVQSLIEADRIVEQDRRLFGIDKLAWCTCGCVVVLGVLLGLVIIAVDFLVGR